MKTNHPAARFLSINTTKQHNYRQGAVTIQTKPNQAMKKTCYSLLIGLASLVLAGAQTNAPQPPPAAEMTNTTAETSPVISAPSENAPAPSAVTNLASSAESTNVETTATTPAAPAMADNTSVATNNTTASETNAETNAPAAVAVAIPQIKFSDVPITTAIENLARLANINYMLDPKIGYGQPDANGQIKAEPTLSIRWENITAENALLALLDNYNLQLIHDKRTGIDRVTTKDPTAPPPLFTKVVQLKYAGVSNMIDAAQSVLTDKRSRVLTDPRTSQLIVVATDPEQQAVETLVAQLDKPTRQVLIETRLVEISSNPKTKKGVDWTATLNAQKVSFGNNPLGNVTYTTTGGFSPATGYLTADGLSVVMSFLNSSAEAQIMSTPRVVTLDNEEAKIEVTHGYPVFNVQAGTQNTAGGSSVTYSNVGTILYVTPRISANDYIWLRVLPEVSSFAGNVSQSVGGSTDGSATILTAPTFDYRKISTQVMIPNANTLVLGGLVQDNPTATYSKVPLLGDVPGVGYLFRHEDKAMDKKNLLIFITPTIVKDTDFRTSDSANFLKSKPVTMKQPMNPNTAWDGPVPAGNWSDPVTKDQE